MIFYGLLTILSTFSVVLGKKFEKETYIVDNVNIIIANLNKFLSLGPQKKISEIFFTPNVNKGQKQVVLVK